MNSVVAHATTVVVVTYAVLVPAVQAAEGGTGNYLQGKRGPVAREPPATVAQQDLSPEGGIA